ncbi:MAG TPA: transposase [Urbifossiella sp.]|jgi:putative transposase|nr:transposase [Urbifossiella sp.]
MADVVARLLDPVAAARVTIRVVLRDKAFFTIPVMPLLRSRGLRFVIPAVVRGRKPRPGVPAVGLRAIRNRGAGRYPYTHAARGPAVGVTVVVAHETYRHGKTRRRHARKRLYATWGVSGSPVAIRDLYRTRFGIESRYRPLGQVRPRTSTVNGVVRLRWVAVGRILRNAGIRFGPGSGRGWTLAAACLVLLAEALAAPPEQRTASEPTRHQASSPT